MNDMKISLLGGVMIQEKSPVGSTTIHRFFPPELFNDPILYMRRSMYGENEKKRAER